MPPRKVHKLFKMHLKREISTHIFGKTDMEPSACYLAEIPDTRKGELRRTNPKDRNSNRSILWGRSGLLPPGNPLEKVGGFASLS